MHISSAPNRGFRQHVHEHTNIPCRLIKRNIPLLFQFTCSCADIQTTVTSVWMIFPPSSPASLQNSSPSFETLSQLLQKQFFQAVLFVATHEKWANINDRRPHGDFKCGCSAGTGGGPGRFPRWRKLPVSHRSFWKQNCMQWLRDPRVSRMRQRTLTVLLEMRVALSVTKLL